MKKEKFCKVCGKKMPKKINMWAEVFNISWLQKGWYCPRCWKLIGHVDKMCK